MPKFRKKPVIIEARQVKEDTWMDIVSWVNSGLPPAAQARCFPADGGLLIKTLEGDMHAMIGDWVIKGVHGEFYPCKPDIFEATYEPAERTIPRPTIEELERILEQKGENVKILLNPDGSLTTTHLDCVASEGCKTTTETIKP